jgi:hypothetical protein
MNAEQITLPVILGLAAILAVLLTRFLMRRFDAADVKALIQLIERNLAISKARTGKMNLRFERTSGNSYTIEDAKIRATAELLGGGKGMLIVLRSIKSVALVDGELNADNATLVRYLGEKISEQKRFRAFVIMDTERVLFSLDKELPAGTRVRPEVTRIR